VLDAWMFGAVVVALLVAAHVFAYRIGSRRQRQRPLRAGGKRAEASRPYGTFDAPITPK